MQLQRSNVTKLDNKNKALQKLIYLKYFIVCKIAFIPWYVVGLNKWKKRS